MEVVAAALDSSCTKELTWTPTRRRQPVVPNFSSMAAGSRRSMSSAERQVTARAYMTRKEGEEADSMHSSETGGAAPACGVRASPRFAKSATGGGGGAGEGGSWIRCSACGTVPKSLGEGPHRRGRVDASAGRIGDVVRTEEDAEAEVSVVQMDRLGRPLCAAEDAELSVGAELEEGPSKRPADEHAEHGRDDERAAVVAARPRLDPGLDQRAGGEEGEGELELDVRRRRLVARPVVLL
mmetsp:Transcript_32552/g.104176  ORF Transcript_32552/g.104176 Transcript_32552/m.104176 type:complete len:239 (-) Transcript_32552:639-1355(-)